MLSVKYRVMEGDRELRRLARMTLNEKEQPFILVERWTSWEKITFEITNGSHQRQRCVWSANANVPHFYSVPAPFDINPGVVRKLYFKSVIDYATQTRPVLSYNYKLTFTLKVNEKTQYENELLCSAMWKPDHNLYLTSFFEN
jgi:hypothetical protein